MDISLVTPAGKRSRAGNRTTAERWARLLRELGHRVFVSETYDGRRADLLIAVHAWRSADSIVRFAEVNPTAPRVVALAGTDIYRFQHSHPEETIASMERASALVCLHDLVYRAIPKRFGSKLRVIHQSAPPLSRPRAPSPRYFEICVVGNLREGPIDRVVKKYEQEFGGDINYTLMTVSEFEDRRQVMDRFLFSLFEAKHIKVADKLNV